MELFKLFATLGLDTKDFDEKLKSASSKSKQLGDAFKGVTAVTGLLTVGIVKAGLDLEAMAAKYGTVFKGYTDISDKFIKDFQKLTPATTAQAQAFASGIGDLLVPMGFAREEATGLTGEFMHVIGALTNFNSGTESAQSVTEKFQAAITGEYDGLKALGIQLDVDTVKRKAVEMGLASHTSEVTKQMQAQVLLSEAYKQSGDALAAYSEENLDTKTKMLLLKTELIDLAASASGALLPVVGALTDGARWLTSVFAAIPEPIQGIVAGMIALTAVLGAGLLLFGQLAGAITAIQGAFALLVPAAGGVAAATATAGAAAGTAAGGMTLLGSAIAFITGPIGLTIGIIIALGIAFKNLWDISEKFREFWINLWEKVKQAPKYALDGIKEDLQAWKDLGKQIIDNLWSGLKDAWQGIQDWFSEKFSFITNWFGSVGNEASKVQSKAVSNTTNNQYSFSVKADSLREVNDLVYTANNAQRFTRMG